MPALSACIVAYNDYEEVCTAVASILRNTRQPDFALFVVDNASPDGTGSRLAAQDFSDARVQVLCLPKNLGFGQAHNAVLTKLHSDVHFILNPDIVLTHDILGDMASWLLARPGAVMATPQLLFPDGRLQPLPRRKPTPYLLFARQLAPRLPASVFAAADVHYTMQDEDLTKPHEIEFCTGSFCAVRTETFRSFGGFDPGYFMYVEDADLTQKALQCGQVYLLPQFTAIHAWHRAPMRDAGKFGMQLKSMIRYFRRWGCSKGRL